MDYYTSKLQDAKLKGKVIAIRVDFNVPLNKEDSISEDTRMVESVPTLKHLITAGAKRIHIISHMGRPKGETKPEFSLKKLIPRLEELLTQVVEFRKDYTPGNGKIQLHENARFYKGESTNDPDLIQKMRKLEADIFINDGFAVSHRSHASVVGLATYVPSYPGLLLQKEIDALSPFVSTEKKSGLTVIVGGAKIGTKINVLKHFAVTAENIIIGGALANTFLAAEGYEVGASLYEPDELKTAREILDLAEKNHTGIHSPVDVVVANEITSTETKIKELKDISKTDKIFDLGPKSVEKHLNILNQSKSIVWNGPLGCFEFKPFENATKTVLESIRDNQNITSILGGGDTLDALKKFNISKTNFTHVSTGGGAMLEYLEGKVLPGIECLYQVD